MSTQEKATAQQRFEEIVQGITEGSNWQHPRAFAIGTQRVSHLGEKPKALNTVLPFVNFSQEGEVTNGGTAAIMAHVLGIDNLETGCYVLTEEVLEEAFGILEHFEDDGGSHPNITMLNDCCTKIGDAEYADLEHEDVPVLVVLADLQDDVDTETGMYLGAYLQSLRHVKPGGLNDNGIFGVLNNVAWTNVGPFDPELFSNPAHLEKCLWLDLYEATHVLPRFVDLFPSMTDYVVLPDVRLCVGASVRLGAYLGSGSVLMSGAFVNYGAGCEGPNMVEGRISYGVWVGADTDIGGGAGIIGTLSGGGKDKINVGRGCLLGSNSVLGISFGDKCVLESGLALNPGMRVTVMMGDGTSIVVKARELSGKDNMLFRTNSETGSLLCLPNKVKWGGLNDVLHSAASNN